MDIRNVKNADDLIRYFAENLDWEIDLDDFEDIDDITYDFDAADIGLKEEAFAKITSLRQLQPLCDEQKWGIFCVEFDSDHFEVSALRKILSGLIPKRRNTADHAVWSQKDLLFLCFWGTDNHRTIGIAHFEDKESGLPQIKMISCAPGVEDFTQIRNFEERIGHLKWVQDVTNAQAWYNQWSAAFVTAYHQVIRDSASLTVKLAAEAQAIRDRILDIYAVETHDGYVHKLFADFKSHLIHDMTKQEFADMYAQTVVYGLFSARCMDKTQEDFSVQEAVCCIPNTNPFLKKLMEECLGESAERRLTFDELEVANVVDVLIHTNTDAILRDFNRQTGGGKEDPVIHFYEEFLTAYDKAQKVQRGVYYTPQPVVNFIVRAVDQILKTEFGLEDGLASMATQKVKVMRQKRKGRGETEDLFDVPAVQILDPATGTGTFLRQAILQIYQNFREKHKGESESKIREAWNTYVPKHLLPRLNGFELMMAPYAVAHMKLAMVLKDTGYDFGSDQRLNVFLTNSLEEAGDDDMQMSLLDYDPLAFESAEANQAKNNNGINVIIGNPPYSGESANKGKWIMNLMGDYKKEPGGIEKLKERNPKWLNDDYVKFIRYSQYLIEQSENGIVAFVNPHGFISNPTFRGMRWNLLSFFDCIYVIDLHGNSNKIEKGPNGEKDENVFDIQQGVCIVVLVKKGKTTKEMGAVYHTDIYGSRNEKYAILNNSELLNMKLSSVPISQPEFFFMPTDTFTKEDYQRCISITELFPLNSVGVVTARDELNLGRSKSEVYNRLNEFSKMGIEEARKKYYLGKDVRDWKVSWAQQDVINYGMDGNKVDSAKIIPITYRPFDIRYMLYTGNSRGVVCYPRGEVTKHFIRNKNIGIITARSNKSSDCSHFYISDTMSEAKCGERTTQSYIFPLYKYNDEFGVRTVNFKDEIATKLLKPCGIKYSEDMALQLFDYIYAVLYSPKYREKYKEFLKIDFPRVPYPTDQESFRKLAAIGTKLRECHLLQCDLDTAPYTFLGEGTGEVIKPEYKNGRVYISKTQYFDNVPQAQWEQYIGGYQPLQKWLKDRKKLTLSAEDIEHYKKIIAALKLTEELMQEVDEVIVI